MPYFGSRIRVSATNDANRGNAAIRSELTAQMRSPTAGKLPNRIAAMAACHFVSLNS